MITIARTGGDGTLRPVAGLLRSTGILIFGGVQYIHTHSSFFDENR